VIYLSGCLPAKPELQNLLTNNDCGILLTPFSQRSTPSPEWAWAADNGCFSSRWNYETWSSWLATRPQPGKALFAVVPDVVANHKQTVEQWQQHHTFVQNLGFKAAFVLQDGATYDTIPWHQLDCLFIGGTTEYKLSQDAKQFTQYAKSLGKWVHMGRVNSQKRIELAVGWGCDSADGTFLAFGPDINTPKLIKMLEYGKRPQLKI
jgi:hypothetical protein